jgi:hypothetical protein
MNRQASVERLAPAVAGLAGLAWFWLELAPQRTPYPDTDDPAMGLAFIAANPGAWPLAGLALGIAAIAIAVTVLGARLRLRASADQSLSGGGETGVAIDTMAFVGLISAAMLFGMAAVRMSGGPVRYVQGLDQAWGEAAYLVTQFVGVQALVTGGFVLLELWLVGLAWLGARRGVVPRAVAGLAVLPAFRLAGILGPFGIQVDGLWPLLMLAIPATFAWLVLFGVTFRGRGTMTTDDILAGNPATRGGGGHLGEARA